MSEARTAFLETADRIGRRLCRDALWAGGQCNWLGWSMEAVSGTWKPAFRAFTADFYGGTSGIALFLAHLHQFTGDKIQKLTCEGAINQVIDSLEVEGGPAATVGFYSGAPGIAYALAECGRLSDNEEWIARGAKTMKRLKDFELTEHALDVISGSAGAIPALLDFARRLHDDAFVTIARRHGDHLVHTAIKADEGWSWDTMGIEGQKPLTGHSHGVAGIAWALLELHQVTGESAYREAACEALRYERQHFSAQHANWPDFRQPDGAVPQEPSYPLAWCHGAPGIGMSRLRIQQLLKEDTTVADEIAVAVSTTSQSLTSLGASGMQSSYCLCHGMAGNAELLLLAAECAGERDLPPLVENVAYWGMQQFDATDSPWPCGVLNAGETPGLLLGTAGIGYFYLRLYQPASVPSVLLHCPGE